MQQRRRHGEGNEIRCQLPEVSRKWEQKARGIEEMGVKSENFKKGMEVAERHRDAPFE